MNRQRLLEEIKPEMRLTKQFFKRMYSLEIEYPGFAEKAIEKLEASGCSRARQYYQSWVKEFEEAYDAEMKEVGAWYLGECRKRWENMKRKVVREQIEDRRKSEYQFTGFPEDW